MYDELTRQDLQKMQEEIDYRVQVLRPRLIEDVQTARAFGDLSENFEYKCAKQEKNRNDSRVRYLQRMIKTARVIEDRSRADTAGLYDTVEILMENTGRTRKIQLVTTLRQDALKGLISKESPLGAAVILDLCFMFLHAIRGAARWMPAELGFAVLEGLPLLGYAVLVLLCLRYWQPK